MGSSVRGSASDADDVTAESLDREAGHEGAVWQAGGPPGWGDAGQRREHVQKAICRS